MSKLAIMSDLHIDVNDFSDFEFATLEQVLKEEKIAHLHLAGDISNDLYGLSQPFMAELEKNIKVSYNLGNHDMLDLTEADINSKDGILTDLGPVQLVSLAGWYDYSFNPNKTEAQHLADKNFFWFDRKLDRPDSDPNLTHQSLTKLEECLKKTSKSVIVCLHFVPHANFIPKHPYFQRFNAFLGSQAFHDLFVQYKVSDVVFGHLHHRHDRVIDGVHYQARPLGYKREWRLVQDFFDHFPEYRIEPDYDLSKRYRTIKDLPEFQTFYQEHLADEFRQAMTIFEL